MTEGATKARRVLVLTFWLGILNPLFGLTFFKTPQLAVGEGQVVRIQVVNGPSVELELSSWLGVMASPFPPSYPQLLFVDRKSTQAESMEEESVSAAQKAFWAVLYGLEAKGDWFSTELPPSRRGILLALVAIIMLSMVGRPKLLPWVLGVVVLSSLMFLPDYERQVLLLADGEQVIFGRDLDGVDKVVLHGKGGKIEAEKGRWLWGDGLDGLSAVEEQKFPIEAQFIRGKFSGFWKELLVIEAR